MKRFPRLLVVSNNGFSLNNPNGRTLGLLLNGWPKDGLAQFCIGSDGPMWDLCDNYYCVTDKDALRSLMPCRAKIGTSLEEYRKPEDFSRVPIRRKTPFLALARNFVWKFGSWRKKGFTEWIEAFNPEIVLLYNSDSIFILDTALRISESTGARIVMFSTEGYCFFKRSYFDKGFLEDFFFRIYQRLYMPVYARLMKSISSAIFLNDLLKEDNERCYGIDADVIYTSSSMGRCETGSTFPPRRFSYFGRFTLGRAGALVDFAGRLKEIIPSAVLDVFGPADETTKAVLSKESNISYCGWVPYEEIQGIIESSDVLLHVETFDERWSESLKYGFSTKIADCLSSGRPLLVYAPEDIALVQYLRKMNCAFVASSPEDVESVLRKMRDGKAEIDMMNSNALRVASANHDLRKNACKFKEICMNVFSEINSGI